MCHYGCPYSKYQTYFFLFLTRIEYICSFCVIYVSVSRVMYCCLLF